METYYYITRIIIAEKYGAAILYKIKITSFFNSNFFLFESFFRNIFVLIQSKLNPYYKMDDNNNIILEMLLFFFYDLDMI